MTKLLIFSPKASPLIGFCFSSPSCLWFHPLSAWVGLLNQLTIQYIPHQTQLVLTTLYAPILLHKTPYSLPKTCCQDCPSFDPQASSCRVADTHTVQICTSPPIPRHAILFRFPILFYWLTVAGIGAPSPVFCRLHFFILKLVVYKGDIHLCRKKTKEFTISFKLFPLYF